MTWVWVVALEQRAVCERVRAPAAAAVTAGDLYLMSLYSSPHLHVLSLPVQALLVTSTYTANLAAFVTVQSIKSSITSVEVRTLWGRLLPPLRDVMWLAPQGTGCSGRLAAMHWSRPWWFHGFMPHGSALCAGLAGQGSGHLPHLH